MLLLLSLTFVLVKAQSAQIQVPECLPATNAIWNWTYNSLEQSPCSTAGYLAAECGNGEFTIPQLALGNHYTGPSGNSSKDLCLCNTVLYSVISACAGCQKGTWLSYDEWTANCSSKAPFSTFPQSISSSTRVPFWAFMNVTTSAPWDNVSACACGGTPEAVGTIRPSFAPQDGAGAALKAVMVGIVTGATVIGLTAIAFGVWYLVRRHRRRRRTPKGNNDKPPSIGGTTKDHTGYESVSWTPRSDMKFYDPSDPSTYPDLTAIPENTSAPASATVSSLDSSKESNAITGAKPQRTHYLGLPEV